MQWKHDEQVYITRLNQMRASLIITFEWSIYHVLYVMYYKYLYNIYEYMKNIYLHLKDSRDESTSKNEKKTSLC